MVSNGTFGVCEDQREKKPGAMSEKEGKSEDKMGVAARRYLEKLLFKNSILSKIDELYFNSIIKIWVLE